MTPYGNILYKYTGKLLNEPVFDYEGYIHEKDYLINLFEDKDIIINPYTGNEIETKFIPFVQMSLFLEDFYIKNPEMVCMRYVTKITEFRQMVENESITTEELISFTKLHKYNNFTTNFSNNSFSIKRFYNSILSNSIHHAKFLISIDDKVYNKIYNKCIMDHTVLHYCCILNKIEFIKYLFSIDKNIYNNQPKNSFILMCSKQRLNSEDYITFLNLIADNM